MINLIGICGYKGSGKTTVTNAAIEGATEFHRIGFADPMYEMMKPIVRESILYDKSRWDEPLDVLCGKTLRHAMVTLGTEWGRQHIGNDLWTNIAIGRAMKIRETSQFVPIIDNVRFPSEAQAILNAGGKIIAFHREGWAADLSHVSEQLISGVQAEFCEWNFLNSGQDLRRDAGYFRELLRKVRDA